MIHYHGTPMGGSRQDVARFFVGRHALVPFKRPDDLAAVQEYCQSYVLDNSAFSYWKAGAGDVDVNAYYNWVASQEGHPGLDWCLIPDKIDGSEDQNRALVDMWMETLDCRVKSVPVWHLHETLEWLDELVGRFETVALGSSGQWKSPGTTGWWGRMAEAMDVVCVDGRPRCKLHGLRMLNPAVFTLLPLASADSTNAAVNSGSLKRFGMYVPPTASQRAAVIADRIEVHNSASFWMN